MFSAEQSSNVGENKVTKKTLWCGNNLNTLKKNLSRLKFSSGIKLKLKFISVFQSKGHFVLVENTIIINSLTFLKSLT